MRAVWLEVPESFLEERRLRGQDKHDEVWDGVLYMVPPATSSHARRGTDLGFGLKHIADLRGLQVWFDATGLFGPAGHDKNYRIPDLSLAKPEHRSTRGLESAELIVEILSPRDTSRAKFSFYAKAGVHEIWLLEPRTCAIEIYQLVDDEYVRLPALAGVTRSPVLGIELSIVDGPKLRLRDGDYVVDV